MEPEINWGTELWDQCEAVSSHLQNGINLLEKYGHYIRERCAIELEYAGKLRKLVKNFQPKKKDDEDNQYSTCKAFKYALNEVGDLAGQHEVIAEELQSSVLTEVNLLTKNLKDERKKNLMDDARYRGNLIQQLDNMYKAKKGYEKATKEAERALDDYQRADADLNLSRAVVERARMNMVMKTQGCEEAKVDYASQLQKTNELQHQHYNISIPQVLCQLQELDEKRVRAFRGFMIQSVTIEKKTYPIMNRCLDEIVKYANQINEKEDTKLVIERYKSGFLPPENIPFEELSIRGSGLGDQISLPGLNMQGSNLKGTLSTGKQKKRVNLFGLFTSSKNSMSSNDSKDDFADLPPSQRRKKIHQRVGELSHRLTQETAARDAMIKMKGVYESNSALGDPMTIEGQLTENETKMNKLRQEINKYSAMLEELEQQGQQHSSPLTQRSNQINAIRTDRYSSSDESNIISADGMVKESSDRDVPDPCDLDEDPPLTPLGKCRALYEFEASSKGSIPMNDGEELYVLENDQGDGWTRVRRMDDSEEEGFVPTSYIEIIPYILTISKDEQNV